MAKQFASAGATETCVTQEQIDQEDVADAMSKSYGEGCTWAKNNIGGGSIDVAGTCTANGQKVDLAMTGMMAPKQTDVTITTRMAAPTGGQMEMQNRLTGVHIGPCNACRARLPRVEGAYPKAAAPFFLAAGDTQRPPRS